MPALSPAQSNIPTWFTEGDRNKGISWIGQDWLNILQAELLNILSEAGIKPDKGKLNQLTLSIKAIITANAYTQANNLKEIFDAGIAAQAAARSHLGLGKLATKDSLGPADVNALAKDQNLADVPNKALARTALQLGNSATRNVGTTSGTVAAGDDSRITGAMQKAQNGADIPNKSLFVQNLGLKETLNPTKRVSIGNIGTGAFDGSTPCINIGDSDSGFIGSADGVIDIYANNFKVGYIDSNGIHLNSQGLHIGDARMSADGNIWGTRWNASGGWLWDVIVEQLNARGTIDWINNQLSVRDNNINTRATWDWVNQHFVQDVRLTAPVEYSERRLNERVWGGVMTSWADYGSSNYHIKWRLLQKFVNGQWLTVAYA
ncbi:hypothetical protein FPM07_16465 [Salmonella enterica]|nr:hypothetical protein [Salmonella enterica]